MGEVRDHDHSRDGVADPDDIQILDDSPLDDAAFYRPGDLFDLYHDGTSVKFRVTETLERDGRRITYGVPASKS